jgi:hypothetical protein
MSLRRGVAVLVGAAVLLAVMVWVHRHSSAPSAGVPAKDVTAVVPGQTIHVASDLARTTFVPLGPQPDDGRTLSAQRAYNAMLSSPSLATPIPAGVGAYYGVLTGAEGMTQGAVRVWAFAVESRCVLAFGALPPEEPLPPHLRCRKWEFLDARSGDDLGVITQQVLPG